MQICDTEPGVGGKLKVLRLTLHKGGEQMYSLDFNSPFVSKDAKQWEIDRKNKAIKSILVNNAAEIKGKKVLDLACNTGCLSYVCCDLGAKQVTGVEVRGELVAAAREIFKEKATFIQSDLFDYLIKVQRGDFDTILCAGFLYHTTRQVEFFREIKRIRPSCLILATFFSKNYFNFGFRGFTKPPALVFSSEDSKISRNTIDPCDLIAWPTKSFLEYMFRMHEMNYRSFPIYSPTLRNWFSLRDYYIGYVARQKVS